MRRRVCNLHAKRMAGVWLTVFLIAFASMASAETAWTVFRERCLAPMEAGTDPISRGLEPMPAPEDFANSGFAFYRFPETSGYLMIAEDGSSCVVTDGRVSSGDESVHEFDSWALTEIDQARYVLFMQGFSHEPIRLRSVNWRAPQIEVAFNWYPASDGQSFHVREVKDAS